MLISTVGTEREGLEYPPGCQPIALAKGLLSLEEKGLVNSGARRAGVRQQIVDLPEGPQGATDDFQRGDMAILALKLCYVS